MLGERFRERSRAREIIDRPGRLTEAEWATILAELRLVNRWLGGRRSSFRILKPLIRRLAEEDGGRPVRVVDFGCGGADLAGDLVRWARRKDCAIRVIGLDRDPLVCRIARRQSEAWPEISIVRGDARWPPLAPGAADIVLCSAFLHHFSNRELADFLVIFTRLAGAAVVISDLRRSPMAYWGIRFLTLLFSRSAAVRHDGPLSVMRGFDERDWRWILHRAQIGTARLSRCWAFRWLVVIPTGRALKPGLCIGSRDEAAKGPS